MDKRNRIKIGIEIECCYNRDIVDFERGSYHDGISAGNSWKIEGDGSLRNSHIFDNENNAEFVSSILGSKKTYIKALKEFRDFFKGYPLSEVLDFNNSCGNHIHIGINNKKKYHNKLSFDIFAEMREKYFKAIKESDKLSEDTKEKILNQYFRGYAQKINKSAWYLNRLSRGVEFNKQSENSGLGIEWRSVNLCGVKTWTEFNAVFEIIYNCVEWLFKQRTTSHKGKFKALRLNRVKLNELQSGVTKGIILTIEKKGGENITLNIKSDCEVLQCVI